MKITALTDIGSYRTRNQDGFYIGGFSSVREQHRIISVETDIPEILVFAADGVGSTNDAEYAIEQLIRYARNHDSGLYQSTVQSFIQKANEFICYSAEREAKNCATTIAGVAVLEDRIISFNAGDSRVYALNNGFLEQISVDDTAITMLRESDINDMTIDMDAKVPILQYLGLPALPRIDTHERTISKRDILICTDGVTDMLSIDEMEDILTSAADTETAVNTLWRAALNAGGHDNITIIFIQP